MKISEKKQKLYIQTDYGQHLCVFEPDENGYIIVAENLPGVVTWGKNLSHAKKMAKEAVELCIESLVESNMPSKRSHVRERVIA